MTAADVLTLAAAGQPLSAALLSYMRSSNKAGPPLHCRGSDSWFLFAVSSRSIGYRTRHRFYCDFTFGFQERVSPDVQPLSPHRGLQDKGPTQGSHDFFPSGKLEP